MNNNVNQKLKAFIKANMKSFIQKPGPTMRRFMASLTRREQLELATNPDFGKTFERYLEGVLKDTPEDKLKELVPEEVLK